MATDPIYVFKERASRNLYCRLKKKGESKSGIVTNDVLGVPPEVAWEHLLMTYYINYGKLWNGEEYHIDHIVPVSTAKTKEDVLKLYHYSNLQMLTPEDNQEKSDSLRWKSPYQEIISE